MEAPNQDTSFISQQTLADGWNRWDYLADVIKDLMELYKAQPLTLNASKSWERSVWLTLMTFSRSL